jgi:hypothetical protein
MIEGLLAAAIGPFGAVAVLLLVLIGLYKLTVSHGLPVAIKYVENQQANMKEILSEHKEDRKVFSSSIQILAKRQDKIEDAVEDIKTDVKKLLEKA